MADQPQLPNTPHEPDTRVSVPDATDDLIRGVFPDKHPTQSIGEPPASSSMRSPRLVQSSQPKPTPKPLDPLGHMFHCMLSYRVDTDQDMVVKLHNKLHTLFALESPAPNSLKRTRSGPATGDYPSTPAAKRNWAKAVNSVFDGSLASIADATCETIPFHGKTLFPSVFERCPEAQTSDFHAFLDKVCLKNGEDWQGSGKADGGGFIGAILQSLIFVPVLTVKQKNSSNAFEVLSSTPGSDYNWSKLEGSLGRLVQLNTDNDDRKDGDNVLLELIIAKVLYESAERGNSASGKAFPCSKILPLLLGGDVIFKAAGMLSDRPHEPTNSKAISALQKAELCDAELERELRNLSVLSVVGWYLKYASARHDRRLSTTATTSHHLRLQGIRLWSFGEESNFVSSAASSVIKLARETLVKVRQESEIRGMNMIADLKPLAGELYDFLTVNLIGYYGPILAVHDIHSIRRFSMLDVETCRELAKDAAERGHRSAISEFGRLWPVVEVSKKAVEAQTLSERLAKFIDKEAHWAAALYSTQAVDILMRKYIFAFIQMCAFILLLFIGFLLTLSPIKMDRTFPATLSRNSTITERIERYNTTSAVCWVAAFFLLLSFCFAWLRSPRSGRVVLALGVLAVFVAQGVVYVFWDPYNSDLCRFKSLEPTLESAWKCIQAYAVSFAITEIVLISIFTVLLFRQELFWDVTIGGAMLYIAPNFIIAQTVDYSTFQYWLSAIIISLQGLLLLFTHLKVYFIRKEAHEAAKDSEELEKKWETVDPAQKKQFKAAVQNFETLGHCVENWSGGWGSRKAIELRSDITDIDFLFAIAEIVNNPIQKFVEDQIELVFGINHSVSVIQGPVKRPSRAIAKVYRVYRGDVSKLTDVVRCQVVFPDLLKVEEFLKHLRDLHDNLRLDVVRIRNRLDDSYNAPHLTGGYRDCNIKIRVAFELDKTNGAVMFVNVPSRSKDDAVTNNSSKCCFGLTGNVTKSLGFEVESRNPNEHHFICELQLILKDFSEIIKTDAMSYKRYVKRRDSLAA